MQLRLHMKCKLMDSWTDVIFYFYHFHKTVNHTSTPLPPSLLHYSLHLSNIIVIIVNSHQIHSSIASILFDLTTFNSWILHQKSVRIHSNFTQTTILLYTLGLYTNVLMRIHSNVTPTTIFNTLKLVGPSGEDEDHGRSFISTRFSE